MSNRILTIMTIKLNIVCSQFKFAQLSSYLIMNKILVIDDEYQNREMLSDFLELKNFKVITANNGLEGLQAFQKSKVDAAIIDIKMPVMNGIDCAAGIRKIKPTFPIIMITGHVDNEYQNTIKKIGIKHLLIKPLNINEIEKILLSFFQ